MIWGRISVVLEASTAKVISPRPNKDVVSQRSRTLRGADVLVCVSMVPHPHPPFSSATARCQAQTVVGRALRELIVSVLALELRPKRSKVSPFLVRQVGAESLQTLIVVGCGELLEARID